MAEPLKPVSAPAFWEQLYAAGNDGWELGAPAPPLQAWLDSGGTFRAEAESPRLAVPGCGRGHDARLLAKRGYRVWGFDFAEAPLAEARRIAASESVDIAFEQRDVFTLGREYPGLFDGVWEYTCFCAIDPGRREEYAQVLHAILRRGGRLLACFFPMREGTDGPPFPVSKTDIERALGPRFRILQAGPPDVSAERRRGLEWLVLAERQ